MCACESYTNRSFQLLIKRLADVAEVAVHPSFASSIDEEKMIIEIIQK